jgi:hypothetical protein
LNEPVLFCATSEISESQKQLTDGLLISGDSSDVFGFPGLPSDTEAEVAEVLGAGLLLLFFLTGGDRTGSAGFSSISSLLKVKYNDESGQKTVRRKKPRTASETLLELLAN